MEQYISILLFIVPGFLMRMIHEKLVTKEKLKSDFEKTVISLIYGIPIIILSYLVVYFKCGINTTSEMVNRFSSLVFIFKYSLLTFIITLIFAIIWSFVCPRYTTRIINLIRKINQYDAIGIKPTTWGELMGDGNKAIKILKNNKEISKGLIKHYNMDTDGEKELILDHEYIMVEHPELFDMITKTYYNIDKDVIIKEYNLDKLDSFEKQQGSTIS